jgi:hypothetical protein
MKEKKRARDNFRIIDIKVCAEIENEIWGICEEERQASAT